MCRAIKIAHRSFTLHFTRSKIVIRILSIYFEVNMELKESMGCGAELNEVGRAKILIYNKEGQFGKNIGEKIGRYQKVISNFLKKAKSLRN